MDKGTALKDVKCPPHLCPGCYGWGFPIMVYGGKVVAGTDKVCPDCNGTGKPKADR